MMMSGLHTPIVGLLLCTATLLLRVDAKVFTHCELAQELRRLQIPESQIVTWVCIAHYESRLNSSAISGSGDHGIFQISEEYWCSRSGRGKACGLACASLEDDDITDDVACVQTIFDEHTDLSGNGFSAWAVYPRCKTSSANRFLKTCSAGSIETDNAIDSPAAPPLDLRFSGYPSYHIGSSTPKQRDSSNYYTKPSVYTPSQVYSNTRPSQDTSSFYSSLNPVNPVYYSSEQNPNREYTYSKNLFESSVYTPPSTYSTTSPPQIFVFGPSRSFTAVRPSSYSIGSIYYNAGASYLGESSTSAPAKGYSYTPSRSYSRPTSVSPSFNKGTTNYSQYQSTTAPPQYKSYTRSDAAVIKTSSPATIRFKAPWEDFSWWNGGKRKYA